MEALVIGIILGIAIAVAIGEYWGRSKHIGRNWSILFLLSGGFVAGLVVIALSPSAKSAPTIGTRAHKNWGYICIILGIFGIFTLNPISIFLISLGIYLTKLEKGEIVNNNPKFYFDFDLNLNKTYKIRNETYNEKDFDKLIELKNKNIITEEEYNQKIAILNKRKAKKEFLESDTYKTLKSLRDKGLLSREEFDSKVNNNYENF